MPDDTLSMHHHWEQCMAVMLYPDCTQFCKTVLNDGLGGGAGKTVPINPAWRRGRRKKERGRG